MLIALLLSIIVADSDFNLKKIQIHSRRRMLDCEKVPSVCGITCWEECWSTKLSEGMPIRDPDGERLVYELVLQLRQAGKK